MKILIHKAETRGHIKQGWLEGWYSFSFGNYFDPERMVFGALRVLNDDIIQPNTGFDMHGHANMEIVTIPLEGGLRHKDSTGGQGVINAGDVQIMSAGTGIVHSEHNASTQFEANTLQIWLYPEMQDIAPRYDQKKFHSDDRRNKWQTLVSPEKGSGALWINQRAWFSRADLEAGKELTYNLHDKNNGVYAFVIDGKIQIGEQILNKRDALGISETDAITVAAQEFSDILLIEVPMITLV